MNKLFGNRSIKFCLTYIVLANGSRQNVLFLIMFYFMIIVY